MKTGIILQRTQSIEVEWNSSTNDRALKIISMVILTLVESWSQNVTSNWDMRMSILCTHSVCMLLLYKQWNELRLERSFHKWFVSTILQFKRATIAQSLWARKESTLMRRGKQTCCPLYLLYSHLDCRKWIRWAGLSHWDGVLMWFNSCDGSFHPQLYFV